MGQGVGRLRSVSGPPASVCVTVFEPFLIPPRLGCVFAVLRYAGPDGSFEEWIDAFPSSLVMPMRSVWSELANSDSTPAQFPVLEICVVTAADTGRLRAGEWQEYATAEVPLAELVHLWQPREELQASLQATDENGQNQPPEDGNDGPTSGWVKYLMLGFIVGAAARAEDPKMRFQRAQELGTRLDVPKVLVVLSDPSVGLFRCSALASSSASSASTAGLSLGAKESVRTAASDCDSLAAVLVQVDAVVRNLHRALEDCATSPDCDRAEAGGEAVSALHDLGRLDREALAHQNAILRDHLEREQRAYEAELNKLRHAHRAAQRQGSGRNAAPWDSPSNSSMCSTPVKTSRCSTPVKTPSFRTPSSREERKQNMIFQQADTQRQIGELTQKLIDLRVQIASAQHHAFAASKEKEETLKLFSMCHQDLMRMRQAREEGERRREQLVEKITELELGQGHVGPTTLIESDSERGPVAMGPEVAEAAKD